MRSASSAARHARRHGLTGLTGLTGYSTVRRVLGGAMRQAASAWAGALDFGAPGQLSRSLRFGGAEGSAEEVEAPNRPQQIENRA